MGLRCSATMACSMADQHFIQVLEEHGGIPPKVEAAMARPPLQQLFLASDGALYGTDEFGGPNGTGMVFKVEHTVTILHQFGVYSATASPRFSNADGALPLGTPCEGLDGKIYGTTFYGGLDGTGGIWRIGKDGLGFELVYSFGSSAHDVHAPGAYPATGLTRAPDGSMYGTTFLGAGDGGGAVYHVVL